ncbi:MAG: D-alanine--D-alanine ligase [Bacteroidales bacterium]|nr:D-alanine--D-alanine ligase [Bacteroidales bacterium]
MMKIRIAIAAGGDSGEYEISIKSATVVEQHLDTDIYEPYLIIFRGNEWSYTSAEGNKYLVNRDDFSLFINDEKIIFDAVFIAIHGTPGEDGKLQGYLDMLDIPYTACGRTTSAITFNKYYCNRLVRSFGVNVAPSVLFRNEKVIDFEEAVKTTGLPCFVKPNSGGSSVGMSKVTDPSELPAAVHKAFGEDQQVLVEGFIPGREITCGVITLEGNVHSLPLTEIIPRNDFFDFEAKYADGMAEEVTPADIPSKTEQQCRTISEMLYEKLDCRGFVRFDYIFNESGIYFLEVNTVPGLSPSSIVPRQAAVDGISLKELFSLSLQQALSR